VLYVVEVPDELPELDDLAVADIDAEGGGVVEDATVGPCAGAGEESDYAVVPGCDVEEFEVEAAGGEDSDVDEEADDGLAAMVIAGEGSEAAWEVPYGVLRECGVDCTGVT